MRKSCATASLLPILAVGCADSIGQSVSVVVTCHRCSCRCSRCCFVLPVLLCIILASELYSPPSPHSIVSTRSTSPLSLPYHWPPPRASPTSGLPSPDPSRGTYTCLAIKSDGRASVTTSRERVKKEVNQITLWMSRLSSGKSRGGVGDEPNPSLLGLGFSSGGGGVVSLIR
jgi:hypothetical protein